MAKKIYLVDTENVGTVWKVLLSELTKEDLLLLFYTEHSPGISYLDFKEIKDFKGDMEMIPCFTGRNGLDFQLVSYLGYLMQQRVDQEYVIVSNDNGYDSVVHFWTEKDYSISRITSNMLMPKGVHKRAAIQLKEGTVLTPSHKEPKKASLAGSRKEEVEMENEIQITAVPAGQINQEKTEKAEVLPEPVRATKAQTDTTDEEKRKTGHKAEKKEAIPSQPHGTVQTPEKEGKGSKSSKNAMLRFLEEKILRAPLQGETGEVSQRENMNRKAEKSYKTAEEKAQKEEEQPVLRIEPVFKEEEKETVPVEEVHVKTEERPRKKKEGIPSRKENAGTEEHKEAERKVRKAVSREEAKKKCVNLHREEAHTDAGTVKKNGKTKKTSKPAVRKPEEITPQPVVAVAVPSGRTEQIMYLVQQANPDAPAADVDQVVQIIKGLTNDRRQEIHTTLVKLYGQEQGTAFYKNTRPCLSQIYALLAK